MKKIILVFSLIVIYTIGLICFFEFKNENAKEYNVGNKLSVMVENAKGDYELSKDNKWPEGYVLNEDLSKCEKGSTLKWNNETRTITLSTDKTDKCYVYFEKDDLGYRCKNKEMASCFIENYEIDKAIIYHNLEDAINKDITNAELVAGDDSYRYAGGNEIVNNYVCLDETTVEEECTDEGLYRIIGAFKNVDNQYEIKLIKNDSIITMSFSSNNSNNWENSDVNSYLNNDFYSGLANFLKNKIVKHNWQVGGGKTEVLIHDKVKSAYEEEINNQLIYSNYVGLIYVSDYGYATYSKGWNEILYPYYAINKNNNWIVYSEHEWLITGFSNFSNHGCIGGNDGCIHGDGIGDVNNQYAIRPAFYLKADTKLLSGEGTIFNPYRLSV